MYTINLDSLIYQFYFINPTAMSIRIILTYSRISLLYPVIPVYRTYSHIFTDKPTHEYMREAG